MNFFGSLFYLGLYFYLIDNVFFKIGDESEEIILLLVNGQKVFDYKWLVLQIERFIFIEEKQVEDVFNIDQLQLINFSIEIYFIQKFFMLFDDRCIFEIIL